MEPLLKNTELDYIFPHTRKSILTSTNPTTHISDLYRNVFKTQQSDFYSQVQNLRAFTKA